MLKIGNLVIENNVVSAPLAGISDKAYRILAKENGCELVYTEMISDKALVYLNRESQQIVDLQGEAAPIAAQIFGSDPEFLVQAAKIVERENPALIDINMGCPSPKIVKNGEGSALMKTPEKAFKLVEAVVAEVKIPVTVKIRKGWDNNNINAVEMAKGLESAGAQAITVHGRTREEFYSGTADWDIIKEVAANVKIPVLGNGDIFEPEDALKMLQHTGCQGVMIARGSFGNPWIFKRTRHFLKTGELLPEPSLQERVETALKHLELVITFKGETIGVREMRKHLAWYLKGGRNSARYRELINHQESFKEVKESLNNFLKEQD